MCGTTGQQVGDGSLETARWRTRSARHLGTFETHSHPSAHQRGTHRTIIGLLVPAPPQTRLSPTTWSLCTLRLTAWASPPKGWSSSRISGLEHLTRRSGATAPPAPAFSGLLCRRTFHAASASLARWAARTRCPTCWPSPGTRTNSDTILRIWPCSPPCHDLRSAAGVKGGRRPSTRTGAERSGGP